jgi:putative DNA primase/helicase
MNIGILLGEPHADVDLDCAEALAAWSAFSIDTGLVFGRASKRASHWFYWCNPPVLSRKYTDPLSQQTIVELRCQKKDGTVGMQTMAPPSIHPSGEAVGFEPGKNKAPANVDAAVLERAVAKTAAAALLARHWPEAAQGRHDTELALAGVLARAEWDLAEAEAFVIATYSAVPSHDPGALSRVRTAVEDTFRQIANGGAATCIPRLTEKIDPKVVAAALEWLELKDESRNGRQSHASSAGSAPDDWPKPESLQAELPPVEAFSEDLLPHAFRALVTDVAERMQVPLDYPAVVMALCLAGAVNRRATIQPKAQDDSWVVVPNLWGGIIAPPGFMKSPVIQAATRPLNRLQEEWRREHEDALAAYAQAQEEHELRRAAWRDQFKAATKRGAEAPDRPEAAPAAPTLKRLIVNDATFEALHQTMSENPAGVLVIRDELTGWWSQLDRSGREGERAFCLQAWNGDTGHTIDRIGRGTIHVPHCCMSMLGGIQPGRLRSYLVDALEDGPSNDGLIQRFQLLVWPDTTPDWLYVDRAPDAPSEQQVAHVFRKLVGLDAENPARFRFASDAQELFIEWLAELEARIRGNELHPALVCHLSKYRSLMPSLALLFELAERAVFDGTALAHSENFASLENAKRAAAWCEYLASHARRVYSCITTPQLRAARELAEKIKERKIGADGFFSCREVYFKGWSGLDSPDAVKMAAEILQDAVCVRDVSPAPGRFGGRPTTRYEINPGVWE